MQRDEWLSRLEKREPHLHLQYSQEVLTFRLGLAEPMELKRLDLFLYGLPARQEGIWVREGLLTAPKLLLNFNAVQ